MSQLCKNRMFMTSCIIAALFTKANAHESHVLSDTLGLDQLASIRTVAGIYWNPSDNLFDHVAWATANAPALTARYAGEDTYLDVVLHWAIYYRISPKTLLALLALNDKGFEDVISLPNALTGFTTKTGFSDQVRDVAYKMSEARGAYLVKQATDDAFATRFQNTFNTFFGEATNSNLRSYPSSYTLNSSSVEDPPSNLMQLPWMQGQTWMIGSGPHPNSSDSSVFNAWDFKVAIETYPADTSTYWTSAAFDGIFYRQSSCSFYITTADAKWALTYYHVSNQRVAHRSNIEQNDKLSNYAGTLSQALCNGGTSYNPHVHNALYVLDEVNNVYVPVDADGVTFSGYTYRSTQTIPYDPDCSKAYFEKGSTKFCHSWTNPAVLYNSGISDDNQQPPNSATITPILNLLLLE